MFLQKFLFEAVTKEGKNMSGSIQAESEAAAREKLTKSGLAVLTIAPFKAQKKVAGMKIFTFEAINPSKKHVKGTIEALDEYAAYKKLRMEYEFEISSLLPKEVSLEERIQLKKKGIDPEYEVRLQKEMKERESEEKKDKKKKKGSQEEIEEVLAARKKEIEFMHNQIDEILQQVEDLIKKNERFLNIDKKREMQERIDLLSRLRRSNSVVHLQNLTKKILKELSDDALFLAEEELKAEDKEAWLESKSEFFRMGKNFEQTVDKGLAEVQSLINKINEMGLKETVKEMRPVKKLFSVLFFASSSLMALCVAFWAWVFIQGVSGMDPVFVSFYFRSGIMWYFTIMAIILTLALTAGLFLDQFRTTPKRLILGGVTLGAILFFTVEFPVIFYWL